VLVLCVAYAKGLPIAGRDGGDRRTWHMYDLDDVVRMDQMNRVITLFDKLDELGHGRSANSDYVSGINRAGILACAFSGCQPRNLRR
jgi:hypothetical protein